MDIVTKTAGAGSSATAAIRAIGPRFDGEVLAATRALFEGRWDLSVPSGGERHFDLAYGQDERQTLDLVSCGRGDAPILLYVPGGGFVGGDKSGYVHVAAAFSRRHLDLADQFGENFGACFVLGTLAIFGRRPLGVTRHIPPLERRLGTS